MRMYKSLPTGHPGGMKITKIYTIVVSCVVQTNYYLSAVYGSLRRNLKNSKIT